MVSTMTLVLQTFAVLPVTCFLQVQDKSQRRSHLHSACLLIKMLFACRPKSLDEAQLLLSVAFNQSTPSPKFKPLDAKNVWKASATTASQACCGVPLKRQRFLCTQNHRRSHLWIEVLERGFGLCPAWITPFVANMVMEEVLNPLLPKICWPIALVSGNEHRIC